MSDNAYTPPTALEMMALQNDAKALQLLVAQRAIYSRAKRYLSARLIGMFLIAVVAPIVGVIWTEAAVVCGAVAGAWIFVGRTWLASRQSREIDRGAAVQEQFDLYVFGMPEHRRREHIPTLEDLEKLSGDADEVKHEAKLEKLRNWYPFDEKMEPLAAVAVSQRANVSYSDSLLRVTSKVWLGSILVWIAVALVGSFVFNVQVNEFLLAVALPLLPAFLDLVEFRRDYESAAFVRRTTASEIEAEMQTPTSLTPAQLLVWQERMYELRRTTPLVPDVIYWLQRKNNERAMSRVARKLTTPK